MSLNKKLGKNLIEGSLLCYAIQKTRQMIAIVPLTLKSLVSVRGKTCISKP